jgi:flagellar hook-length control protein FliK
MTPAPATPLPSLPFWPGPASLPNRPSAPQPIHAGGFEHVMNRLPSLRGEATVQLAAANAPVQPFRTLMPAALANDAPIAPAADTAMVGAINTQPQTAPTAEACNPAVDADTPELREQPRLRADVSPIERPCGQPKSEEKQPTTPVDIITAPLPVSPSPQVPLEVIVAPLPILAAPLPQPSPVARPNRPAASAIEDTPDVPKAIRPDLPLGIPIQKPIETTEKTASPTTVPMAHADLGAAAPALLDPLQNHPEKLTAAIIRPSLDATQQMMDRTLDLARDTMWLNQLASDIVAARGKNDALSFRLIPPRLGQLDVAITANDSGLHLNLQARSEEATQIISAAQPRLIEELRSQGVRVSGSEIGTGGGTGTGQQSSGGQQGSSAQREPYPVYTPTYAPIYAGNTTKKNSNRPQTGRFA